MTLTYVISAIYQRDPFRDRSTQIRIKRNKLELVWIFPDKKELCLSKELILMQQERTITNHRHSILKLMRQSVALTEL
ncbi:hypothetical protein EUGRSUZ_F01513 [Eucalyptus grandis]|uniref:Uncharacterized protein n=2 Tax=Eucalyptus grandis TaxID=71139 RepID=A0ACC3KFB0_EUCGR|nr:hypothetical protein EUGRSUZ_F01513 [Eucalyptus grandis]